MSLQSNFNMESKESGLTVGELTIAISILIFASIIWTSINKKEETKQSFIRLSTQSLATNTAGITSTNARPRSII